MVTVAVAVAVRVIAIDVVPIGVVDVGEVAVDVIAVAISVVDVGMVAVPVGEVARVGPNGSRPRTHPSPPRRLVRGVVGHPRHRPSPGACPPQAYC